MSDIQFSWPTFAMALAGFAIHLLSSWGEFYRAKDTARMGLVPYLSLDAPAWGAAFLGAVVAYFSLPELAEALGASIPIKHSPFYAALFGYIGSSAGPKLLGIAKARAGVR